MSTIIWLLSGLVGWILLEAAFELLAAGFKKLAFMRPGMTQAGYEALVRRLIWGGLAVAVVATFALLLYWHR